MFTPLAQRFCHPLRRRVCRRPRSPLSLAVDDICTSHCGSRLASVVLKAVLAGQFHSFYHLAAGPVARRFEGFDPVEPVQSQVATKSPVAVALPYGLVTTGRPTQECTDHPTWSSASLSQPLVHESFLLFHLFFLSSRRHAVLHVSFFFPPPPSINAKSAGDPAYRRATNSVLRRSREDLGALSTLRCFRSNNEEAPFAGAVFFPARVRSQCFASTSGIETLDVRLSTASHPPSPSDKSTRPQVHHWRTL